MTKKKITSKNYTDIANGIRLSAHEKLCAERMDSILKSIERLEKKVEQLSDHVSTGKGIVKVLVVLGSLVAGIIGYFNFK
jgi:uncharacterized membrane protein YraQ (UPF0718 family)